MTAHAIHLAEMRASLPPAPAPAPFVTAEAEALAELRRLAPSATRRHLAEMRMLNVLADGACHVEHELVAAGGAEVMATLTVAVLRGDVEYVLDCGWRMAGSAA